MFGYIRVYKPELTIREYEIYRSYYCGLCRALKKEYGWLGQATLTYDMAFLALFLTSLYEPKERRYRGRCMVHPGPRRLVSENAFLSYAADMNVLLSCLKFQDDVQDEGKKTAKIGMLLFRKAYREIQEKYPGKAKRLLHSLKQLSLCEKRGESSLDIPAGYFGEMVEELFMYRPAVKGLQMERIYANAYWEPGLRRMGYFLGKFIYLADAFYDVEEDAAKGNYNVFLTKWREGRPYEVLKDGKATEEFRKEGKMFLRMMMAECAKEFEKLPVLKNAGLLRNILYAGVWCKDVEGKKGK